jgi:hypothetical protein
MQKKGQSFRIPLHKHFERGSKSMYKIHRDKNKCLSASILLEETTLRLQVQQDWPWTRKYYVLNILQSLTVLPNFSKLL